MRMVSSLVLGMMVAGNALAAGPVTAVQTPFNANESDVLVLKNDSFTDQGGQAYLQLGFVADEKAGVWVRVPDNVPLFKIDYFRVLMGSSSVEALQPETNVQIFFQMGLGTDAGPAIPAQIENAAQVTPGPYWNDIPAEGADESTLGCARAGEVIGAALEFTHTGAPSIYRDIDGLANPKYNTLFAIPGGWNYSVAYGLRGDWILRVVGHEAKPDECGG